MHMGVLKMTTFLWKVIILFEHTNLGYALQPSLHNGKDDEGYMPAKNFLHQIIKFIK